MVHKSPEAQGSKCAKYSTSRIQGLGETRQMTSSRFANMTELSRSTRASHNKSLKIGLESLMGYMEWGVRSSCLIQHSGKSYVRLRSCLHQVYSSKPFMKQQVAVIELQCIWVVKLGQHFTKAITTSANITYVCCYSVAVILHLAVAASLKRYS